MAEKAKKEQPALYHISQLRQAAKKYKDKQCLFLSIRKNRTYYKACSLTHFDNEKWSLLPRIPNKDKKTSKYLKEQLNDCIGGAIIDRNKVKDNCPVCIIYNDGKTLSSIVWVNSPMGV